MRGATPSQKSLHSAPASSPGLNVFMGMKFFCCVLLQMAYNGVGAFAVWSLK